MQDNAFLSISDFSKAQELSDNIRAEDLHKVLDIFAQRYCPIIKKYGLKYHWSIMQAEYATDIIFKKQADLQLLYEPLIRTAVHSGEYRLLPGTKAPLELPGRNGQQLQHTHSRYEN